MKKSIAITCLLFAVHIHANAGKNNRWICKLESGEQVRVAEDEMRGYCEPDTEAIIAPARNLTPTEAKRELAMKNAAEKKVIATIKYQLRDAESARFRNMRIGSDRSFFCGEVNAKNSLGGYTGFQRFFANVDGTQATVGGDERFYTSKYAHVCNIE